MGIIERNEFHAILCLEVESIVVIVFLWIAERMLHLVELASHHDRTIDQSHLGGIVLGCLLSELHSQLYFYLITSLPKSGER